MKLEDIRLGQTLTVSHIPEYILSNDGISKILCSIDYDKTVISDYLGKIGTVCAMWSYSHDITSVQSPRIELKFNNERYRMFPPEALSPALQHFPSNNDIQVGDFIQVFGSDNVYEVLDISENNIRSQCINSLSIIRCNATCIKTSIRPAPKKDQVAIGAACVTTPDAVDFDGTPISNMLGLIRTFARQDDTIYVSWANNTVGWIERKYIIQL